VICYDDDWPGVSSVREVVGGLLLRHTCQLVCNAYAITGLLRTNAGPQASTVSTGSVSTGAVSTGRRCDEVTSVGGGGSVVEEGSVMMETSQQLRIATAIYPTASLMNHACDPSVISRSDWLAAAAAAAALLSCVSLSPF